MTSMRHSVAMTRARILTPRRRWLLALRRWRSSIALLLLLRILVRRGSTVARATVLRTTIAGATVLLLRLTAVLLLRLSVLLLLRLSTILSRLRPSITLRRARLRAAIATIRRLWLRGVVPSRIALL